MVSGCSGLNVFTVTLGHCVHTMTGQPRITKMVLVVIYGSIKEYLESYRAAGGGRENKNPQIFISN